MNTVAELHVSCNELSKEYHNQYLKWLKTEHIDYKGEHVERPKPPTLTITREQEYNLRVEDREMSLFPWYRATLDGFALYGVSIEVVDK